MICKCQLEMIYLCLSHWLFWLSCGVISPLTLILLRYWLVFYVLSFVFGNCRRVVNWMLVTTVCQLYAHWRDFYQWSKVGDFVLQAGSMLFVMHQCLSTVQWSHWYWLPLNSVYLQITLKCAQTALWMLLCIIRFLSDKQLYSLTNLPDLFLAVISLGAFVSCQNWPDFKEQHGLLT